MDRMFDFEKADNSTTSKMKIEAKVRGNVEFLMDSRTKWKRFENKVKLANVVMPMNMAYVHQLNAHYFKESGENLVDFVEKQLGAGSTAGAVIKIKIEQSCDFFDYFARKLQVEASNAPMNRIFVATVDDELAAIQQKFNDFNYGDGKTMVEWIKKTQNNEKYALCLTNMLQNCPPRHS